MTQQELTDRLLAWQPNIDAYHDDRAISHSGLEMFRSSPELFDGVRRGVFPSPFADNEAIRKSTICHLAILEPERFEADVLEIPVDVLSASGSKAGGKWTAFRERYEDKILVKDAEMASVRAMQRSVQEHTAANVLLISAGHTEVSLKWLDGELGIERRARIDRLTNDFVIDVKTLADVSPEGFAKAAYGFGYARQRAFYRDALSAIGATDLPFVFVCVQKTPPYTTAVYELDEEFVRLGAEQNWEDLKRFVTCVRSGVWRSPAWGQIIRLSPPRWAKFNDYDMGMDE